jgi:UDP-N-acetylmuramyl pentapeptide phosphotransferase/UDP-N-acetylglucosamine-1-phosphate transferase
VSPWLLALAAPAAITLLVIAVLRRTRWAARLADHPNERSLHTRPTPRLGGLAIMVAALPVAAFLAPALASAWALAACLALVSLADDFRSLPIAVRLPAHFTAAAIVLVVLAPPAFPLAAVGLCVLAIAWMTNLYNFMDGADGLAGGMSVIGFAAYALAAHAGGAMGLALGSAALASAALGFLVLNFPPARVFMGDAGSIPLGFLAAALGLQGLWAGAWPAWFPVLVFSPFIVDASVTIARRLARGERVWIAHRQHAYQRLVLSGWSARRLALAAYGVMLGASASALAARAGSEATRYAILVVWCGLYAVAIFAIHRRVVVESASS